METYHKINTLFKRDPKGKMLMWDWTCPEFKYLAKNEWDWSEKVDGTNIRVEVKGDGHGGVEIAFAGRSDKAQIPSALLEALRNLFSYEKVNAWWANNPGLGRVILYGEGYGHKIQKAGPLYVGGEELVDFALFDVKIGDFWLDRENVSDIASKLDIRVVPSVGSGSLLDAIEVVSTGITFGSTGNVVRWGRGTLQSTWGHFNAEGIVARPVVPLFDRQGNRIITKIKAVDFK